MVKHLPARFRPNLLRTLLFFSLLTSASPLFAEIIYNFDGIWYYLCYFDSQNTFWEEEFLEDDSKTIGTCHRMRNSSGEIYNSNTINGSVVLPSIITINLPVESHVTGKVNDTPIDFTLVEIGESSFYGYPELTSIKIPNTVLTIENEAFKDCINLSSVKLPNSLTKLGNKAFNNCTGLTSIIIPNSVRTIGDGAFNNCSNLASVTLSESLTSIGSNTFAGCSDLTSIAIPNTVTSIDKRAFYNCSNLTSVTLSESLTSICDEAFAGCSDLTSITIPNTVTSIGRGAFYNCSNLTSVTLSESLTHIWDSAFEGCSNLTSINIPNSVTSIDRSTFSGCSNLTSVTLSESLTHIWESAFAGCSNLTSINIPNSVTHIGHSAFMGCVNLEKAEFESIESLCGIEFANWDANPLYYAHHLYVDGNEVSDLIIPNSIKKISEYTFAGCSALKSVVIPNSVESIEDYAFSGCKGVSSVFIPNTPYINNLKAAGFKNPKYYPGDSEFIYDVTDGAAGVYVHLQANPYFNNSYKPVDLYAVVTDYSGKTVYSHQLSDVTTYHIHNLEWKASYRLNIVAKNEVDEEFTLWTYDFTTGPRLDTLTTHGVSAFCVIARSKTNVPDWESVAGVEWKEYGASDDTATKCLGAVCEGLMETFISDLKSDTLYEMRPFYKDEQGDYCYGEWISFNTSDYSFCEPEIRTYPILEVATDSVTVRGYALSGTDNIKSQGFQYWRSGGSKVMSFAPADSEITTVPVSGQIMTATFDNLAEGTTYTYRAYVETEAGFTYGEEQSFTTKVVNGVPYVEVDEMEPTIIGYYDLNGRRYDEPQPGLNIVVYSNGKTRKIMRR